MNTTYRLYVGLSQEGIPEPIDGDQVIAWVAQQIESFAVLSTQGFFRGYVEDVLVFSIVHDDQRFIVNLTHKLRAKLNQEGIGLEYGGAYHRMTEANDPRIHELAKRPRLYPNYNVKVGPNLRLCRNWCRANDIGVRVFENVDGGGWNFFIFEFTTRVDAEAFAARFGIRDENSLWVESEQGEIQYITIPTLGDMGVS